MKLIAAAALLGGCARIFNLDPKPTGPGDDGGDGGGALTGTIELAHATRAATGAFAVADEPEGAGAIHLVLVDAAGVTGAPPVDDGGRFTAQLTAAGPYRLSVIGARGGDYELQTSVRDLQLRDFAAGRTGDRTLLALTTAVTCDLAKLPPSDIAGNFIGFLAGTDLRTATANTVAAGKKIVVDWEKQNGTDGAPAGVVLAGEGLWCAHDTTVAVGSTPFYAVDQVVESTAGLADGATVTLGPSGFASVGTACMHVVSDPVPDRDAIAAALGQAIDKTLVAHTWQIDSVPDPSVGLAGGIGVMFPTADLGLTAIDAQIFAPAPFPGDALVAVESTNSGHAYTLGESSVTLETSITRAIAPPPVPPSTNPSCPQAPDALFPSLAAPLVTQVMLAGVALAQDDQEVAIDRGARVVLEVRTAAAFDRMDAILEELRVQPNSTSLDARAIATYRTLAGDPTVSIDPALLVAGHTYVFEIRARTGFPNAASGDLSRLAPPFVVATSHTASFTTR